jgi:MtrB/PioB family decaheme-associated outer membrane protein
MFITKTTQVVKATVFTLALIPTISPAEEATGEVVLTKEMLAVPSVNEIELGAGYVFDDAYHFGRYNGLIDQGAYAIGNVRAKGFGEAGGFWRLRGTNLGLDSRYMRLDGGVQGRQEYFIEFDQLPDYENDTAWTPFRPAGSTRLYLPANFDVEHIDGFLLPFDQHTERKRLGVGARFFIKSRWEVDGSFHHETKDGTDWIGGSMGPLEPERLMEKTTGSLLPEPIDYETNKMNLALRYTSRETQMEFAYHGSLFNNHETSLTWQDPFDLARTGRIGLEPDNQMHQLSATLGHMLSPTSRLTALVSLARLTQDDDFLPYSTTETNYALPRDSLDGEVWVKRGMLKLTSRPLRRLRLSAQYRYDERDNKTDVNDYYYYLADGRIVNTAVPRQNDPLSYRRHQLDLSANYRINSKMSLRGGYQYTHMHRDSNEQERETTREHTLTAKWHYRASPKWDLSLYGESTERSGSTYQSRYNENYIMQENPAMRVFNLADVERTKVGTRVNYMPDDRWSLGLIAEYLNDDYTDSPLGLTEAQQPSLTLNANYLINDQLSTHAFYSYQEYKSSNAGADCARLTSDWWADLKDTTHSFGLGGKLTGLFRKWDFGADLVYTRSRGEIDMSTSITEICNPDTGAEFDPGVQQFPDLKTSLRSLQLWGNYQYSEKIAYKLSYWYEAYNTEDWPVDGIAVDSFVDTYENNAGDEVLGGQLLFGEDRLDYTQHVVGLSVNVQF